MAEIRGKFLPGILNQSGSTMVLFLD